jgi:hypothetical protein
MRSTMDPLSVSSRTASHACTPNRRQSGQISAEHGMLTPRTRRKTLMLSQTWVRGSFLRSWYSVNVITTEKAVAALKVQLAEEERAHSIPWTEDSMSEVEFIKQGLQLEQRQYVRMIVSGAALNNPPGYP